MNERTISRRTMVTTGLGAIAAPAVLRTIPANAQSRTIKIGHVSPRTGPLAAYLRNAVPKAQLEVTEDYETSIERLVSGKADAELINMTVGAVVTTIGLIWSVVEKVTRPQ